MSRALSACRAAGLLLMALPATAPAATPGGIEPFHARYELGNGSVTVGRVDMRLQRREQGWEFSSSSKPSGLFALFRDDRTQESSRLAPDPREVRPLDYRFHQSGSRQLDLKTEFDWDEGRALTRSSDPTDNSELPLQPGTQDRLSVLLELVRAVRQGRDRITIEVNEKGESKTWVFEQAARERVRTAAGPFEAVKIVQQHQPGERYTATWLAPEAGYLPIRVEQYKNGDLKIRMDLKRLDR